MQKKRGWGSESLPNEAMLRYVSGLMFRFRPLRLRARPLPFFSVQSTDGNPCAADPWNDKLLLLRDIPRLKSSHHGYQEHRVKALVGKWVGDGQAGMTHLKGQVQGTRESMNSAGGASPGEATGAVSEWPAPRGELYLFLGHRLGNSGKTENHAHLGSDHPKHRCHCLVS